MNPLLPLNTPEAAPSKPSLPPKPDPRRNFEAHVRSMRAPEQGRGDADALPHGRQDAQLRADDAAVPLDVRLAMAGMSGRIYPQGLHATGYLSMLDSDRPGMDGVSAGGASPELIPAADAGFAAAVVVAAAAAGAGADAEAMAARVDGVAAPVERNGGSTNDETAELRTGSSGDFAEWARRMVRFSDGSATLWIRDYRLDAPQRQALIEQLYSFARDAGQPLRRIVLNGEDIWREGALNPYTGKGEPHGR